MISPSQHWEIDAMTYNPQQDITNRILAKLEAGVMPWRKDWSKSDGYGMFRNRQSGRPYSGVNVIMLMIAEMDHGYSSRQWLTYKQATELGGHVREGEKATRIVYISQATKQNKTTGEDESYTFLKTYNVFNLTQCEGLEAPAATVVDRQPDIEELIDATGAKIDIGEYQPSYIPSIDTIRMPQITQFETSAAFYSTLLHELGHWTGAPHRLNRLTTPPYDRRDYGFEELVAELTASFVCAEYGIDTIDRASTYLGAWIKMLKEHPRAIIKAASQASKAVEYLRHSLLADAAPLPLAA
jgi:antirestriction protein ArdC